MGNNNFKPIVSFSVNEVVFVNRLVNIMQLDKEMIPAHNSPNFASIKLKSTERFKPTDIKAIRESFKKKFNSDLKFEYGSTGNTFHAYVTKRN